MLKRCFAIATTLATALQKEGATAAEAVEVIKIRFGYGFEDAGLPANFQATDGNFPLYCTYQTDFVEWVAVVNLGWSKKFEIKGARSTSEDAIGEEGKFANLHPLPEERDGEISEEMRTRILERGYQEIQSLRFDVEDMEEAFRP